MGSPEPIRAGDLVLHRSSGDRWVVAIDQIVDRIFPAGWPEFSVHVDSVRLLEAADDEKRLRTLKLASHSKGNRAVLARLQLAEFYAEEQRRLARSAHDCLTAARAEREATAKLEAGVKEEKALARALEQTAVEWHAEIKKLALILSGRVLLTAAAVAAVLLTLNEVFR